MRTLASVPRVSGEVPLYISFKCVFFLCKACASQNCLCVYCACVCYILYNAGMLVHKPLPFLSLQDFLYILLREFNGLVLSDTHQSQLEKPRGLQWYILT